MTKSKGLYLDCRYLSPPMLQPTPLYEFRSVITHQGASADSRHYTAFVKKSDTSGRRWWSNDDKVSEVDERHINVFAGGGQSHSALILLHRAVPLLTPDGSSTAPINGEDVNMSLSANVGHSLDQREDIEYDLDAQQPPASDFQAMARKPIRRLASNRTMTTVKPGVTYCSHLESVKVRRCSRFALASVLLLVLVLTIIVIACQ